MSLKKLCGHNERKAWKRASSQTNKAAETCHWMAVFYWFLDCLFFTELAQPATFFPDYWIQPMGWL
jgi:hypothetical protein